MSALFATLPESGRAARVRRSPAGVVASIVLHAAVITLVVRATLDARDRFPGPAASRVTRIIYRPATPEPLPPAAPGRSASPGGGLAAPTPVPQRMPSPRLPLVLDDVVGSSLPTSAAVLGEFAPGTTGGEREAGRGGDGPPVGGVFSAPQVDVSAVMLPGGRSPRYPEALRAAGTGGRVVVHFVVDTAGRVEPATVRVVASTDELFAAAVRATLPSLRFTPARANGGRVRQLVELPFDFEIGR
jgi:protein TonB